MNSKYEQGWKENAQFPMFAPPPPVKQTISLSGQNTSMLRLLPEQSESETALSAGSLMMFRH